MAVAVGLTQLVADGATRPVPPGSLSREFAVAEVELAVVRRTDPQLVNASALANHLHDILRRWRPRS
ncbi:hypothetical protein [Kribbella sp. C-35]|uniref:hypothetical protein n=1 Tax=Kribbella sp. C-35 TaxID=2789276 RepID=UPI0039790FBB